MYVLGFAETKKDTTWYNYTIVATPIHTSLQWFTVPCWGTWKNFLRYFCGQSWASSSAQDLTQLLLNCWQMLKNHWTIYIPSIHLLYLLLHLLLPTSVIHAILNQSNPKWPYFSDLVNASDTKDIRPQEHQNMRPLPSSTNSTRLSRLCRGSCSTWHLNWPYGNDSLDVVSGAPRSVAQNSRDWFMTLDDSELPSLTLNGTRCSVLVWLNIWLIGACFGKKLIPAHRGKPSHPGDVASPSCSGRISNEVSSLRRKDLKEMNEAIKT